MRTRKLIFIIMIMTALLFALLFISPLLVPRYAEEQYFTDQYNKNKDAFTTVKNELLHELERENKDILELAVSYDPDGNCILYHDEDKTHIIAADTSTEAYCSIAGCFGSFVWNKARISEHYIDLSEEGNNYQYVYCENQCPETMIYGSQNDIKIHNLGDGWYLIVSG